MAAGTVGYTDTRSESRDYLGMIAGQISKRVGEASDMAASERQFAEDQAEAGGTSLEEAGIGKGYFFGRALGSKFGGDRIARTRGRFSTTPTAGTNPAGTAASRFRGGFNYTVENSISPNTDSPQIAVAMSGVADAMIRVSQSLIKIDSTLGGIERTQMNMARAIMFQGYVMQMLKDQQAQAAGRASMNREERSIERGGGGGGSIGGQSFGGAGGGRGMINVSDTRSGGRPGGGSGGGSAGGPGNFGGDDLMSFATSQVLSRPKMLESTLGGITGIRNLAKTGKVGSTVAQSDVLKAAFAGSQGFDPAKVSRNVNALLGTGSGLGMKLTSLFGGALGFDAAKVGAASLDEAILTGKMVDAMMVNGKNSPMALEAIADMYNYKIRGADDKFVNELMDIQTRSNRYKKYANLHGNNKLTKTVEGSQYLSDLAMDRKVFQAMRKDGKRMFNNDTIEAFLKMGLSPGEYNVLAYNALETIPGMSGNQMNRFGIDAADTMENFGIKGGIAEDLQKFFPGGAVKMANAEQALILTRFARELDAIKVGKVATKAEAKAAMTNVELLFGQKKVQKAIAEGGEALATNTGVMKSLARVGGKRFLDMLPGIGLAMGTYFAIDRARKGDYFGAGLEITSGLLGLLPGVGTGFGLAIDGYLLGRDMGVMPLKDGVVATGKSPVPAVFGEAGLQEAAFPLEGSEGVIAGSVFGNAAAAALAGNFFATGMNSSGDSLMQELSSSAQDISNKMNQLSTEVKSLATSPQPIINNITNNNVTNGGGMGGGDDVSGGGGNFSDSGLDAWRLNYLGSLA